MIRFLLIILFSQLAFANTPVINTIDHSTLKGDGINHDALIIAKDGEIVFEQYFRGYDANTKHVSWSMAKTIAGILIGIAVDQGHLNYEDPVSNVLPQYKGKGTIYDFLQMSSGIAFQEQYAGLPISSDVVDMLYVNGPKKGFAKMTLERNQIPNVQPGEYFSYTSGTTNALMEALKAALPEGKYKTYPWDVFFKPLGIENATFEMDSSETYVGSSYIYMTPREFLKIGLLLANDGVYNGKRIIPKQHMDMMKVPNPAVTNAAADGRWRREVYSMQTWINQPIPERNVPSPIPHAPEDMLFMLGFQGQIVAASAKENLVVVRNAIDESGRFKRKKFFENIFNTFSKKELAYTIPKNTQADLYREKDNTLDVVELEYEDRSWSDTWNDFKKVPWIISSFFTKEVCSCHFVVGRSVEQCANDVDVRLPLLPNQYRVDANSGVVKAQIKIPLVNWVLSFAEARFRGPKHGCYLVSKSKKIQ